MKSRYTNRTETNLRPIRRPLLWARGGRNTGKGCRARGNRTSADLGASAQAPPGKPSAHSWMAELRDPQPCTPAGGPPAPTPCGPHWEGGRAASTSQAMPRSGPGPRQQPSQSPGPGPAAHRGSTTKREGQVLRRLPRAKPETQTSPEARAPGGAPLQGDPAQNRDAHHRRRARSQVPPHGHDVATACSGGVTRGTGRPLPGFAMSRREQRTRGPAPGCVCTRGSCVRDSEEKAPLGEEYPRPGLDLGWMLS